MLTCCYFGPLVRSCSGFIVPRDPVAPPAERSRASKLPAEGRQACRRIHQILWPQQRDFVRRPEAQELDKPAHCRRLCRRLRTCLQRTRHTRNALFSPFHISFLRKRENFPHVASPFLHWADRHVSHNPPTHRLPWAASSSQFSDTPLTLGGFLFAAVIVNHKGAGCKDCARPAGDKECQHADGRAPERAA